MLNIAFSYAQAVLGYKKNTEFIAILFIIKTLNMLISHNGIL